MKVLVACEFSGVVRDAFCRLGHDAVSCDLLPSECPGSHIQDDVLLHLDDGWDLMIAHPPCTYLAVSGNRSFKNNPERWKKRYEAALFAYRLFNADIPRICLENPVSVLSSYLGKPSQCIQPYMFGHPEPKKTCLWLKGLPCLKSTKMVSPEYVVYNSKKTKSGKSRYSRFWRLGKGCGKERSVTFPGIADAMAHQWGINHL